METSLPKHSSNLSKSYVQNRLDFIDYDLQSVDISNLQQEKSPLIRLLEPLLTPKNEIGSFDQPVYNPGVLKLLDDLQCPVLLLPRIKNEGTKQRIGFLTDLLFTSRASLALLVNLAKSFQASITIFNIAEPALPEMDAAYSNKYFKEQGLSQVNGLIINLVNLKKATSAEAFEAVLDQHNITMAAATQKRKDLLYRLIS